MRNHHGFLLIEFLIYFFLLVVMMTLIGGLLVSTQRKVSLQSQRGTALLDHWFAVDRFMRDVRQAPSAKSFWKKITPLEIIWCQNDQDVCWCFEKNKLFRIEGAYDSLSERWGKHTKNLVSDKIQKFTVCAHYDSTGHIRGCTVDVVVLTDGKPFAIHRVVALQGDGCYA